jgi:PAS domain S-box-containing protein
VSLTLSPGTGPVLPHPQKLVHEHVVYLYRKSDSLLEALCDYIGPALAAGNAAIVVATQAHRDALEHRLMARGVSTYKASQQGRYIALDASETLSKIMLDGMPDATLFDLTIGGIVCGAKSFLKNGHPEIAIFGEMVALLSAQGKIEAAIRLEQPWNDLAMKHSLSLRCAYPIANFSGQKSTQPLIRVCAEHSAVLFDQNDESGLGGNARIVLRRSEERFRLLVEAVQDYAIFMLDAHGRVSTWNNSAERMKGYKNPEIIGRHFSVFYPEEDRLACKPQRELEIAAKEGRLEDEGWRIRKDGSRFWANVIITALRDDAGRLIGFGKVTRDFTERVRADQELRKEVEERREAQRKLQDSEKSLRQLSLCLLQSQDEERRRIGRDLHDSVGQYLVALKMKVDSLKSGAARNQFNAGGLAECAQLTEEALKDVRTMSYLLYPPLLEELGLKSAVPWYLDGFTKRSGIKTTLEIAQDFDRMAHDLEVALFRVLQESLTNVHRHSGSPVATVRLVRENDTVTLQIIDEGCGIRPENLDCPAQDWMGARGVGLRGMNERIHQLGGSLEVSSRPGGTTITATVPISVGAPERQAKK